MPETWLDADSRFNILFIGLKQLLTTRTRTSFPPRRRLVVSLERGSSPQHLRVSNRSATRMRLQKKVCRVRVKTEPKHLTTGPEIRLLHDGRELDLTEANKMDGCGPSQTVSAASASGTGVGEVRTARRIRQTTRREERHASK